MNLYNNTPVLNHMSINLQVVHSIDLGMDIRLCKLDIIILPVASLFLGAQPEFNSMMLEVAFPTILRHAMRYKD